MTTTELMLAYLRAVNFSHFVDALQQLSQAVSYQPEFPFIIDAGFFGGRLGFDPIVTARVFNVFISLLGGYGILLLGQTFKDRRIGYLAMLLYMLLPFSIFLSRSLLPENLMNTVVIWAMVIAVRTSRSRFRDRLWIVLLLILCPLAKLPAAIFLPLIALIYWFERRSTPLAAGLTIAAAALLAYFFTCMHYNLRLLHPLNDARWIQLEFKHLVATPDEIFSWRALEVLFFRSILALTLPGCLVMLGGMVAVGSRIRSNYWLLGWIVIALAAGLYNIKANTYWICPIVAPGVLLIACFIMTVPARRLASLVIFLVLVVLGLQMDPGWRLVEQNLAGDRSYKMASELRPQLKNPILFRVGATASTFQSATEMKGTYYENFRQLPQLDRLLSGEFEQYLTANLISDPFNQIVFQHWPIVFHQPDTLTLFDTGAGATLGAATALESTTFTTMLGSGLRIREFKMEPASAMPGQTIHLHIAWEKVASAPTTLSLATAARFFFHPVLCAFAENPPSPKLFPGLPLKKLKPGFALDFSAFKASPIQNPVTLEFKNLAGGVPLPLIPRRHAAVHPDIGLPQLQLPAFAHAAIESIDYEFELPSTLPSGSYLANLVMYNDALKPLPVAQTGFSTAQLNVEHMETATEGRFVLGAEEALWFSPVLEPLPLLWGRSRYHYWVADNTRLFLTSPLPAGKYEIEIIGRGDPAGGEEDERWPELKLEHPTMKDEPILWKAVHSASRPQRFEIEWQGPADFISIRLDNPYHRKVINPFPLYLNANPAGRRQFLFEKAIFTRM